MEGLAIEGRALGQSGRKCRKRTQLVTWCHSRFRGHCKVCLGATNIPFLLRQARRRHGGSYRTKRYAGLGECTAGCCICNTWGNIPRWCRPQIVYSRALWKTKSLSQSLSLHVDSAHNFMSGGAMQWQAWYFCICPFESSYIILKPESSVTSPGATASFSNSLGAESIWTFEITERTFGLF